MPAKILASEKITPTAGTVLGLEMKKKIPFLVFKVITTVVNPNSILDYDSLLNTFSVNGCRCKLKAFYQDKLQKP